MSEGYSREEKRGKIRGGKVSERKLLKKRRCENCLNFKTKRGKYYCKYGGWGDMVFEKKPTKKQMMVVNKWADACPEYESNLY